jgi:hypothetical protein
MKKPRLSHLFISLLLVILCLFCYACNPPIFRDDNMKNQCQPLPRGFSNASLTGTWIAESLVQGITDTLYIRADGTYKQIIHIGKPNPNDIDYESDWQSWRFEPRPNGTGYLHMEGFRGCAATPEESCEMVNNGKTPQADACEGKWMEPDPAAGENVLVVNGYPFLDPNQKISHPFSLTLFRGFESSSWEYYFMEP